MSSDNGLDDGTDLGPARPLEDSPVPSPPVDRESLLASDVVSASALDDTADLGSEDQRGQTDRQILEEIVERVRRIEEQLEKGGPQVPPPWERR